VSISIRPARPDDNDAILTVVGDAFSFAGTRNPDEEVAIVRATWIAQKDGPLIELVAETDNGDASSKPTVVGHLQAAPGRLDGHATRMAGVAPVCVAGAHQCLGIGHSLMGALLRAAERERWPLLVLLGDPSFYGRFGFEPASALGLSCPHVGANNPHFQARRLPDYSAGLQGEFNYCWE
jgi:putative acetyltransferase